MTSFTQCNNFVIICTASCVVHSFLLLGNYLMYGYSTNCLSSILLFVIIWFPVMLSPMTFYKLLHKNIYVAVSISSMYTSRNWIIVTYRKCMFKFLDLVFKVDLTILHIHQQYRRLSVAPYTCQHLIFYFKF